MAIQNGRDNQQKVTLMNCSLWLGTWNIDENQDSLAFWGPWSCWCSDCTAIFIWKIVLKIIKIPVDFGRWVRNIQTFAQIVMLVCQRLNPIQTSSTSTGENSQFAINPVKSPVKSPGNRHEKRVETRRGCGRDTPFVSPRQPTASMEATRRS